MRTLLATEFKALIDRAGLTQAGLARLCGVTPRQVNNLCRGRGKVPRWAALLALALEDVTPEELTIRLDEVRFEWFETLGVPASADATALRKAMSRLALACHPDKGRSHVDMERINAAYAQGRERLS